MVDANCGWQPEAAQSAVAQLDALDLEWIEEPMAPNCSDQEWMRVRDASRNPLAGGENFLVEQDFERASAWLGVVQPDLAKWGGVSGVWRVGRAALQAGLRFCPHSFGTHIAAMTSAHVLAAVGGNGYLELDVNPNPLRNTDSYSSRITEGVIQLDETPGIGVNMDAPSSIAALLPYLRERVVVEARQ